METETKKRGGILRWFAVLMAIFIAAGTVFGMTQMGGDSRVYAAEGTWIYVDGANGNDSNDGNSASSAVKSWEKAKDLLGCAEGGIYVVGTVQADGDIYTKNPSKQTVKRTSDITMFEVSGTANFISIDVDGGSSVGNFDSPVIKPNSGAKLNFLKGAKFHNVGYVEESSVNATDSANYGLGYPDNTTGGCVVLLERDIKILVDGAEFTNNDGKGIFFTPNPPGIVEGKRDVYLYMKSGRVENNKGFFYFNEQNEGVNKVFIYNALVRNNDASQITNRYSALAGRTGAAYVCDMGAMLFYASEGAAIFDNTNYDLIQIPDPTIMATVPTGSHLEITGSMLGGGNSNWGDIQKVSNAGVPDYAYRDDYYIALKSNPSDSDKQAAASAATSIFENNKSVVFDSNGRVQFGRNDESVPETPTITIDQGCDNEPTPEPEEEPEEEPEPQPEEPTTPVVPEEPETDKTEEESVKTKTNIEVTKTLTGADLTENQFTFKLFDENGNEIDTKTNDANGKVVFKEIEYTEPGTYNYVVKEVDANGNDLSGQTVDGIKYDTAKTVTVTVTAEGDTETETTTAAGFDSNYQYIVDRPETAWSQGRSHMVDFRPPITMEDGSAFTGKAQMKITKIQEFDSNGNLVNIAPKTIYWWPYEGTPVGYLQAWLDDGRYEASAVSDEYVIDSDFFTLKTTTSTTTTAAGSGAVTPENNLTYSCSGMWTSKTVTDSKGNVQTVYCVNESGDYSSKTRRGLGFANYTDADKRNRYGTDKLDAALGKDPSNTIWGEWAKQLLASVLYYGQQQKADYGDIQKAVYLAMRYGGNGLPSGLVTNKTAASEAIYNAAIAAPISADKYTMAVYGPTSNSPSNNTYQWLIGVDFGSTSTTTTQNYQKLQAALNAHRPTQASEVTLNVTAGTATFTNTIESKPEITNTTADVEGVSADEENAAEYTLQEGETEVVLSDTIKFTNLDASKTYEIRAMAYDANGNEVRNKPATVSGKTEGEVTISFDRKVGEGTYNIKATIKDTATGETVAEHNVDYSDISERAIVKKAPEITSTTANVGGNAATSEKAAEYTLSANETETQLSDTIVFKNLDATKTYEVRAMAYDENGTVVRNKPATVSGQTEGEVTISFDRKVGEGTYKIKATIKDTATGEIVAEHNDNLDETSETAIVDKIYKAPGVETDANGAEGNTIAPTTGQSIVDNVTLTGLVEGVDYKLTGKLMIQDGSAKGTEVTTYDCEEVTLSAEDIANGKAKVTFTNIDASELAGKTLVVFETLSWTSDKHGDTKEVKHEDIKDDAQSVSVDQPGSVNVKITGKKGFKDAGGNAVDSPVSNLTDMFQFGIYDENDQLIKTTGNQGFRKTTSDGSIYAGFDFKYTEAGTYTYKVKENKEYKKNDADYTGISIDAPDQTVIVKVVKDGSNLKIDSVTGGENNNGVITVSFTGKNGNTYEAPKADRPTVATKAETTDGNNLKPEAGQTVKDTVTLTNLVQGTEYTITGELHIKDGDKDGGKVETYTCEPVVFTAEADGDAEKVMTFTGIDASNLGDKDLVVFETLTWTDDVHEGDDKKEEHHNINDAEQTVHVDKPAPTPVQVKVSASKTIDGDASKVKKDAFKFVIYGEDGNAVLAAGGNGDGSRIVKAGGSLYQPFILPGANEYYTEAGTYTYTIKEDATYKTDETLDYDVTEKQVKVVVTLNEETNAFEAKVNETAVANGGTFDAGVFNNTTKPKNEAAPAAVVIKTKKTLEGKALEADEFTFALNGSGQKQTAKNKADGEVEFKEIKYTAAGEYTYTISENKGSKPGMTYDNSDKTVKVKVNLNEETNALEIAEVTGGTFAGGVITVEGEGFANTYTEPEEPAIGTTATDGADEDKTVVAEAEAKVVDVVEYVALKPNTKYTVTGTLMNKKTGKEFKVDGKAVTKTAEFTTDATGCGTVKLEFVFDASALKTGDSLVAFEAVSDENGEVAVHKDLNDPAQTVDIVTPDARTTATDNSDGDKTLGVAGETEVKDVVKYTNLTPGKTYTLEGKLVTKSSNGKTVVATKETTFTPGAADGETELTFKVNTLELAGEKLVAFETVKYAGREVVVHANINDGDQTVEVETPEIKTTATDAADGDSKVAAEAKAKVKDVVEYKNLIPGKKYTMSGELVKKSDKTVVATAKKDFTADDSGSGKVTLTFTFDASDLAGESAVAFETAKDGDDVIAVHADINDRDQTVEIEKPDARTTATDNTDGDKILDVEATAQVKDIVKYTKLTKGKTYTLTGKLVTKSSNGKTVVATQTTTFTPSAADGEVELVFDVDTTKFAGEKLVAFETVSFEGMEVVVHADINDADQTVEVKKPEIATTATDKADGDKKVTAGSKAQVVDVVKYSNLKPGKQYTMSGELVKKSDKKVIAKASKKFTASENGSGTVTLTFTFDASKLAGESAVAFETAKEGNVVIATHADLNDADQTVEIVEPEKYNGEIRTTVEAGGKKGSENAEATLTAKEAAKVNYVTDTIDYTGLVKGDSYKVTGTLMKIESDKETAVKTVTDTKVAEDVNGQWTITFTGVTLESDSKYVVYEEAVNTDTKKAEAGDTHEHKNKNDKAQTVVVEKPEETPETPEIKIATKAELGAKSAITEDGTTTGVITQILDTVSYEGLETGKTYKLVGKLMDKATQNEVDANYYTCSATEVKPTAANGTAFMIFDLTKEGARALSGREIVVYEKLFEVKVNDDNTTTEEEVAKHEDITDKNQTVKVPEKENPTVEISKTAVADSAELPGAKLVITKKGSDEVLYQHTSTNQTWKVKLAPGEYTLTEITAPKGYEVAESIDFTVNENGLAGGGKVHMEDAPTPEEPKPEITEVTVNKVWDDNNNQDGKRTENVTVNLLADGTAVAKYVLNSSNNWTHTFTALPKKNAEGKDFVYTVVETEVPAGYEAAVNGFTITNKHTPETVTITGIKTWNDADNQDGKRPASITVNLLANGTVKDSKTVTQKDNWTYTWKDLPKYENGSEIKYTVTENKVEGYQVTSDGINIINNYTPGKTSVSVVKAWADENDKDAIRPASVSATLYADGATVDTQVLSADNGWTYTWTDLDEMKDGKTIVYTVDEAVVPEGYGKAVTENNGTFVITNTHTPSKEEKENPTVTISKTDAVTTAELPGATLIIKNKAGETVVTFVSGDEPTKFQLEPGEYTLTEVTAPKGYEVAETISFTVDANGLVGSEKVEMKDAPIVEEENPTVTISKIDAATTAELPGATLIIRNAEGKIVENFVSGSEPTLVQLAPGEYTLTELTAPQGYQVAETISFTVDANGLVGSDKVEMKDAPIVEEEKEGKLATTVHANGTVASNAAAAEIDLQAKDGAVNVVDYIVYTDLKGGVTYAVTGQLMKIVDGKAVEVVAERTYDYTADASGNGEWVMVIGDVTVEQDTKYVVFETAVEKNVAEGETPETIEHKDANDTAQTVVVKPYVEGTEVEISKQDATTKEELPGAQLVVKNTAGDIVAEWTSGTTPHKITLKPGNYTLTEITAPDGYLKAETIAFTVDENGLVGSDKVVMLDAREDLQNIKNTTGVDITAEKFWTTGWPEGVSVTFTLQYYDGGEWKTYYKEDGTTYTVTIAEGEVAVFENVPVQINDATAKYRVVEDAVDGYNVKEWKATDFDNFDGTMSVTNQPNGGKQETTPGESTDKEQTTNNETPSSETGEENPQTNNDDNNNNDKNNNNGGDNNTGVITPAPGRTTSGGYPTTPVTTRRTGTYATSTPSVSSSTATSTGDTNNAALWIVLAAAASAAIAGAAFGISRRRRHEG